MQRRKTFSYRFDTFCLNVMLYLYLVIAEHVPVSRESGKPSIPHTALLLICKYCNYSMNGVEVICFAYYLDIEALGEGRPAPRQIF